MEVTERWRGDTRGKGEREREREREMEEGLSGVEGGREIIT